MAKKVTPTNQGREVVSDMTATILKTFSDFETPVEIINVIDGYSSYHFYIRPLKPMRMKAFASFVDDLKYALSNDSVEIEAPVPNEKYVGITVKKKVKLPTVPFADAITWEEFTASEPLCVPLGIDEFGNRHVVDIAKMPHALIAGTTGSGKSMLVHSIINALIEKNTPEKLRLILIDPKGVELTLYDGIPHLMTSPVTNAKKAILALKWATKEMERRYDILQHHSVQNIAAYHKNICEPASQTVTNDDEETEDERFLPESMPYIGIVIDEISDLMHSYPDELESAVVRLAQMSRAVGIHLLITTQRPSVTVITGAIKANIPTRIAFSVASQVDSRTVLDCTGAEKLRGNGDMLFQGPLLAAPLRIQSVFVSESEIIERVKKWVAMYEVPSMEQLSVSMATNHSDESHFSDGYTEAEDRDGSYSEAKKAVIAAGRASTSFLQRRLRIGYSKAARLIDLLEERGVIGPADGAKPREIFENKL